MRYLYLDQKECKNRQLEKYLKGVGIHCSLTKMSRRSFSGYNQRIVGFILVERKPVSHLYLARPLGNGQLQLFDYPSSVRNIIPAADESPVYILLASRFSEDLPKKSYSLRLIFSGVAFVAGILFIFFGIWWTRCRKNLSVDI
jgi:hypothetical protein